jgi:hypothetical protein
MSDEFEIKYEAIVRDFLKYLDYQATHHPGTKKTDFIHGWEMAAGDIQRKFKSMLNGEAYHDKKEILSEEKM